MKGIISMSRHTAGKKSDRSTLYGVFIMVALLPTAFSVAYEYSATGITSGRPWLVSLPPLVLLIAARFIPTAWSRSIVGTWLLTGLATVAGAGFVWHLSGLLGFLGVVGPVRIAVPVGIAVLYGGFGALMGFIRDRASRTAPHITTDRPVVPVRQRVSR